MLDNTKIRVLLVEDSEDDALLTDMQLRRGGYEPYTERVESLKDMESALEEKQWDLIISDFSLPNFTGPDALKLYKEKGLDIPFIVVSGAIGEETAIGLMHEGAHDYIMKDNLARLVPAVQREIRDSGIRAERRQAAKALGESETRYRMLAENVADIIWTTDLKLKITYITPSIDQVLGYPPDEALALPLKKFLSQNSYRKLVHLYRKYIETKKDLDLEIGQPIVIDLELIRKDGSVFWAESKMAFLRNDDGIPIGVIGVVRDIDALKKSEENLMRTLDDSLKSKMETEALLESAHSVLVKMPFKWKARTIFDFCRSIIGATAGFACLLSRDGDRNEVLFTESGGITCTVDPSLPMLIRGLSKEAYRTGTTFFKNDFSDSKQKGLMPEGHMEIANIMLAPLIIGGKVSGLLGLANKPGGFVEEDIRVASAFADIAAIALHNSRTLELLEKSEHQYRNLFSSINDVIIVADNNGNIIDANQPALKNQFGYELNEILSLQSSVLYANADSFQKAGTAVFNERRHTSAKIMDIDFRKKKGETFPAELHALKLLDENSEIIGNLGIIRDITNRKKADSVLRESEKRYRELSNQFTTLLDAIPDPLMLISRDNTIQWANISATTAFNLDVGDKTHCFHIWHRDDSKCKKCPIARSFESGREENDVLFTDDNRVMDIRAFPIKDDSNNVINVIELAIDITEKRKLQAERMRAAHLASLGELAAGVAHEINNPNAGIILNTQLLVDDLDMDAEERDGILGRIIANSDRIDRIVSKLLSFARADSEERQSVDIIEIVKEVQSLIAGRFEKSGIKMIINLPDGLPRIWAHPQQMEQIFMNLCTNSLHALKNFVPQPERDLYLEITGNTKDMDGKTYVQVVLYDNGTGISEKIIDRVLVPFFTTKPKGQGTGLGLSISHEIIKNHEGNMELESVEGEFTKITVSVPVMEMKHEA